ncbi:alpha/beta fold hydrolase [Streptomyces sp. URMC 126]|uniref:alpha/beta fold hydrolase n=1 Tax=Streptomyces sp. URMC 126 TaxID=3423401 RepID=UPI003F1CC7E7
MSDLASVVVNGVRLAYRAHGPEGAPPVVLLHCLGANGGDWAAETEWLAAAHRVYAVDLRGHGASEHTGDYALPALRDDVLGLLDSLGLERVTLIGHSLGGVVAQLVAQERPSAIARLVLEEAPALLPADPPAVVPPRPDGPLGFDWAVKIQFTRQRNAPDPGWTERLAEITAPTLVVTGGTGGYLPPHLFTELLERLPDGRPAVLEGAGHLVHTEQPAAFRAVVERFLAETADRA